MSLRKLVLGVVAGLLVAGFHNNAQADTFTNGDFITYVQADWGDTAGGTDAEALLLTNYNSVFASTAGDFEVGSTSPGEFAILFTDAPDLITYLPAVGNIGSLNADLLNPTTTSSGEFGGDVTALDLNIAFSDAGLLTGNLSVHFGDLVLEGFTKLKNGVSLRGLNSLTVRQFSAGVNTLLGGGSFGSYTIDDLEPTVQDINGSFGAGVASAYATEHLVVPPVPLVMQAVSQSGGSITFTWSTTPASMYQIQFITDLTQTNWTNVGNPIRATNLTWTASETMTNSQGFYRIDMLP